MSIYATIEEVQRRMPQFTLTPTSKPSLETAQVFLDDVHSHFDAAMSNLGYVTPITGELSVAQAREIVSQGTIARILYARGAGLGTDAAFQSADRSQKQYDDALRNLADRKHPAELSDAARNSDETQKPDGSLSGLLVNDDGDDIVPRATMDMNF